MVDEELKAAFAQDVVFLRHAGLKPGRRARRRPADQRRSSTGTAWSASSRRACGSPRPRRMDVVRMVLAGQVQRELVGLLNQHGPLAVGMTGEDAHTITATKHQPEIDGEPVDIGRVGEITAIDTGAIEALLDDGRIPVVSSIARSRRRRPRLQRQRRHRGRRARRRAGRRDADGPHRRRGPLRGLAEQRRGDQPAHRHRAGEAAARPGQRHGAQDGGLPARRTQRRAAPPASSTAGSSTRSCWRSSPTRASARWSCPTQAPRDRHDATGES